MCEWWLCCMCKGLPLQDIASFLSFLFFFSFFSLSPYTSHSFGIFTCFLYANISLSLSLSPSLSHNHNFCCFFSLLIFFLWACEMVQISPTTTSTHFFYGISSFWLIFIYSFSHKFCHIHTQSLLFALSLSHSLTSILRLSSLLLLLMLMTIAKGLFYALFFRWWWELLSLSLSSVLFQVSLPYFMTFHLL
jgi:hypothetical protein